MRAAAAARPASNDDPDRCLFRRLRRAWVVMFAGLSYGGLVGIWARWDAGVESVMVAILWAVTKVDH